MPDPINWSLALPYYLAAIAGGYLLGSIPSGLILTRLAGHGDVRNIGSGNIGATNVLRTGSKALATLTLIADILKGTIAVRLGFLWGPDIAVMAGLGAFLGHLFPVWLRFRGGKGVATYIGVLAGLYWPAALIFGAVWLATAALTRYSSLSALIASLATPGVLAWFGQWQAMELFILLTLLVYVRHAGNIKRLAKGEESRIGAH